MLTLKRHIALILTLLLLGGMATETWAAYKVTYYILTLPLNHETGTKNTKSEHDGKRIAAIKAFDDIGTVVGLDEHLAHFKSPLAKNFSYFDASIVKYDGAKQMYETHTTKYPLYVLNLGNGPISPYIQVTVSNHAVSGTISECTKSAWEASDTKQTATTKTAFDTTISGLADGTYYFKICLDEESAITANCDIFVTYEYNPDNGIAKLDGSESYNIEISGGFVAYNKGRNNRMAVIPAKYSDGTERITGEQLSSKKFVKVDVTGTAISPWWNGNLTPKDRINSYYHFLFKYEGEDPYNITIRSAYEDEDKVNPDYYIELYGSSDTYSVNKLYEGSSIFAYRKSTDQSDELLLASDDNVKYTTPNDKTDYTHTIGYTEMPGFYRNLGGAIWNSFAMLNNNTNTGYVFMGTKCVKSDGTFEIPSDSKKENGYYKYYYFNINDQNKLYYTLQTAVTATNKSSTEPEMYEIHTYTFKVKTPSGATISVDKDWSEAYESYNIMEHLPDGIKRKYVSFDGAYKTDAYDGNNEFTTFADANTNATVEDGKKVIWLKYSSSMPFEALPLDGDYRNARWYTMRMNGDVYDKYLAYDNGSRSLVTTDGSGATKGSDSDVHQGEAGGTVTQVAFMGDPFELKILSHEASEGNGNCFIGCATDATNNTTLNTNKTGSSDFSTWEIVDDDVSGSMALRQFGTATTTPMYVGWNSGAANKPVVYSTTPTRIKVVALQQKEYIYHIMRGIDADEDGYKDIAAKASITQDIGKPLNFSSIPEIIRSPFLALPEVTVKFYHTSADAADVTDEMAAADNYGNCVPHAPFDAPTHKDIYVRYFGMTAALEANRVHLDDTQEFNVRLNGQYIYYSSSNTDHGYINSQETITDEQSSEAPYVWKLIGSDPYAMQIFNAGPTESNNYIQASSTNGSYLSFGALGTAAKFIVKSGTIANTYEVMYATGDAVDASSTYYNIGRYSPNEVKIYNNDLGDGGYPHGYAPLRFVLTLKNATAKYYHLIDKQGKELLQVRTRDDRLSFPSDYWSPLVETYHYYLKADFDIANGPDGEEGTADDIYTLNGDASELASIGDNTNIYVTYDANNLVNLQKGALYLLRFDGGDSFRQEDGHDNLTESPVQAIYPYCNGDCNFFVYGQDEYELQQQGAASTRTRWVWYVESNGNDPYHVKITSRQSETYNSIENQAYFRTCVQSYGGENHIITTLAWPGITGEQGTEYMVLGSVGQYQLVTTETIPIDLNGDSDTEDTGENERQIVKSFEQYWKTYDTVKNKLLTDILEDKDKGANPTGAITVPETPSSYRTRLTGTGDGQYGFHSYSHWAYAKRFNGYNASGETKKGWEAIEHWYQTVNMGEGYFDFVATNVDPALILIDQHGWEIMRKPLPSGPDENPEVTAAKLEAIRPYNSPMVKEYYFWSSSKKMTNYHQYYNLGGQITLGGEPYKSSSLTDLPPYDTAVNVKDSKDNLNDQYVTYVVKDEYAQSYTCTYDYDAETKVYSNINWTPQPFLIQQGEKYVYASNASTLATADVPASGGMAQAIVAANGSFDNTYLWYVKPNASIDNEMGYGVSGNASSTHSGWNSDYIDNPALTGYPSSGFDPYNIQIVNVQHGTMFATNASSALLDDGVITGNSSTLQLGTGTAEPYAATKYYDNSKLAITNTTFMAVQDEEGNMQLMPRFDQNKRVRNFGTLETPVGDADKLNQMMTKLFRPQVYNYHIIDNAGNESLCYKSGGDLTPQTPDHFKSPLATDFKYYTTLTDGVASNEITESFASATLTDGNVYVRYSYNEDADGNNILKGKWFTMQLNEMDAVYNSGIKQASASKPDHVNASSKDWQWKLLETPQGDPDPYAVYLYNRSQSAGMKAIANRFALLPHTSGGYALAVAGSGSYTYDFLNGSSMNTTTAATTATESGFTSTVCSFTGTNSQVQLLDDVEHTFTYKVYTNDGVLAISEEQGNSDVVQNDFVPILPEAVRTPLLNIEDYRYYNKDNITFGGTAIASADTTGMSLSHLYGLYEDVVCVHYLPYNPDNSTYKVPNDKRIVDGHVARGTESNDASLVLEGTLLYNIIWYNDNMMYNADGTNIQGDYNESLKATPAQYVWQLEGSDPYAIKIKSHSDNKYISSNGKLSATAQTFMLLPKEDYGYGVLAVTGTKGDKLTMTTDDDNDETKESVSIATTEEPTQFVFFALATHKVIYHLVIAKTATNLVNPEDGCYETIPYYDESTSTLTNKNIPGSTQRDLTSHNGGVGAVPGEKYQLGVSLKTIAPSATRDLLYCYDAGHISLGDKLDVPLVFYRPNVFYDYYVEGVYIDEACTDNSSTTELTTLNSNLKGRKVDHMGDDTGLLGKTVLINIVYTFDGDLETNSGSDFVRAVSDNKWYSFETRGATPYMAQFTNAMGGFEVKEGRGSHYTNDYLWSPLGDPYGFRMYNRYIYKNSWNGSDNSGEINRVMTTVDNSSVDPSDGPFREGKPVTMSPNNSIPPEGDPNNVYELLSGNFEGYFHVHPVTNNEGTKYYLRIVSEGGGVYMKLSTVPTDLTFGFTEDLVKPYYDKAGYVGGLTAAGKTAYEAVDTDPQYMTDAERLMAKQAIVYNSTYIVPFASGYYRMHSPGDIDGINEERYASGYTHALERDPNGDGDEADAVPMHFYERKGSSTMFSLLRSKDGNSLNAGYTVSNATRGEIPIPEAEYDPASIFYITGTVDNAKISTQGLYVKGAKGKQESDDDGKGESVGERAEAYMTSTPGEASELWVMDIGGAVMLIHDRSIPKYRKYLSYDQTDADHIYDLKLTHNTHTDHAKWNLQPANNLGLKIKTHSGGDAGSYGGNAYYYATFYAPFDIMLPNDNGKKTYKAFLCDTKISPWNGTEMSPRPISWYNIEENNCPSRIEDEKELFRNNNRFVPAGTPVILSIQNDAEAIKATLPTNTPSPSLTTGFKVKIKGETLDETSGRDNTLTGQYLEQLLNYATGNETEATARVYSFGLPFNGTLTPNWSTGEISASLPTQDNSGWGFYLNANPNKEAAEARGSWMRNNWYVLGNKVYYLYTGGGSAPQLEGVQFVPVIFDGEEPGEEELQPDGSVQVVGDGCIYDLLGRKVATKEQVEDGTWRERLAPGIYILNGKKFKK